MKTLEGTRLRMSRAYDVVLIHTNNRTLGLGLDEAEQLLIGLQAILHEGHEEAFTLDTLEPPRRAAPEIPQAAPRKTIPTLDMI